MKIPVNVSVKTKKILGIPVGGDGEFEAETREVNAAGYIHTTKDGLRLEYTEKAPEGAKTITTVNLLGENLVTMSVGNSSGNFMVFEEGKTHSHVFDNGFFPMELRVKTNKLKNTISKTGGKLDVTYTVDIIANRAENNHISLSVYPDSGSTTS